MERVHRSHHFSASAPHRFSAKCFPRHEWENLGGTSGAWMWGHDPSEERPLPMSAKRSHADADVVSDYQDRRDQSCYFTAHHLVLSRRSSGSGIEAESITNVAAFDLTTSRTTARRSFRSTTRRREWPSQRARSGGRASHATLPSAGRSNCSSAVTSRSIRSRHRHRIDHQHIDHRSRPRQLQAKLLLYQREE